MRAIRLFVYGSLLRGERHHDELAGANFVREARTAAGFAIYDLGDYPTLAPASAGVVWGEVYEVGDTLLAALDAFEGEQYVRGTVPLDGGDRAQTYLCSGALPAAAVLIPTGSWRTRRRSLG